MTLDELQELWSQDSRISIEKIDIEAVNIPQLHSKYYQILSKERLGLRKLEADLKVLYQAKHDYFSGAMDRDTLAEHGWVQCQRTILKSDIPNHISADQDYVKLQLRIAYQQEKVYFLESIIKNLTDRQFMIKNYIEWQRFKNGGF